ncbi:hypothetical protein, partial [Brevibacillus agri]|uniref:hypothetical protein n=1 Tax=Brevibacillus agri TaxID=51101 RepID=UPI003D19C3FE
SLLHSFFLNHTTFSLVFRHVLEKQIGKQKKRNSPKFKLVHDGMLLYVIEENTNKMIAFI